MRPLLAAAVPLALALAAGSASPAHAAAGFTDPAELGGGPVAALDAATNAAGTAAVAWRRGEGVRASRRTSTGGWTRPVTLTRAGATGTPEVLVTRRGAIVVAWVARAGRGAVQRVVVARPRGSFGAVRTLGAVSRAGGAAAAAPALAELPSGDVALLWRSARGLALSVSGAGLRLRGGEVLARRGAFAALAGGRAAAAAAWVEPGGRLRLARVGRAAGRPHTPATGVLGAPVLAARGATVVAAWRTADGVFAARVGRAGARLSALGLEPPRLALGRGGAVAAAWRAGDGLLAAQGAVDGGLGLPARLPSTGDVSAAIALPAAGGAVAVWAQRTGAATAVVAAERPAGAAAFGPVQPLHGDDPPLGRPLLAAAATGPRAVVAWRAAGGVRAISR